MRSHSTDTPIHDIAYLARADHRIPALVALTTRHRSRAELCEMTGVSSSTIRRTLGEFEDRNWIRKDGYQYVATQLGKVVASGMEDLIERVETERRIRDVWQWLPEEVTEFPIETWSDMTVTVAEPNSPYRPVKRFESRLKETDTFRFLRPEVALMEPCFDVLHQLVENDVDVTLIDRPSCHSYFFSTYPERSSAMVERDNFTVLEHEDLPPYGIGLIDDIVAISCFGEDSGTVKALVDTDEPVAREWAESTFASFERGARPVTVPIVVE